MKLTKYQKARLLEHDNHVPETQNEQNIASIRDERTND